MSVVVQHRRGTRTSAEANTPAAGELWFDTTLNAMRIGDGATAGGHKAKRWGEQYTVSPAQITTNVNDYNPTDLAIADVLAINSDAARTITGIAGGAANRALMLLNTGSFTITLADASASSTAANRFSFGADYKLRANYAIGLLYVAASSRWFAITDAFAWKTISNIAENLVLAGVLSPSQITSNQNDYAPTGLSTAAVLRLNTDASRTLTGITAQTAGTVLKIINVGTNNLVLSDADVLSSAANRFSFGASKTIGAKGYIEIFYDGTDSRWKDVGDTAGAAVADSAVTAVKLATSAVPQGVGMLNGTLAESHAGSAVTFAIKTLAGADPSAADPVYFCFRNESSLPTGNYFVRTVTAALSFTISSGSSMGFTNSVPGRLWLGALDNGGTVELFAINCLSGTDIYPLGQFPMINTTAEGGAGAADSAQVAYSASVRTNAAYVVLGYASYETGLAAAGTWSASPTRLQLFGHGVPLPGTVVQEAESSSGAAATGTTLIPFDDTIPQNTEGDQYLSKAITPNSAANLLDVTVNAHVSPSAINSTVGALFQDSTANALIATQFDAGGSDFTGLMYLRARLLAATTVATTFKFRAGASSSATLTLNGRAGGRKYGGVFVSRITIREVMA